MMQHCHIDSIAALKSDIVERSKLSDLGLPEY